MTEDGSIRNEWQPVTTAVMRRPVPGREAEFEEFIYGIVGVLVWLAVFESGVHATVAGVLVAMTVPARSWINASEFLSRARRLLDDFASSCDGVSTLPSKARQQAAIEEIRETGAQAEAPLQVLQSRLNRRVVFVVLPVFALANAGVALTGLGEAPASPVTLGVFFGLLVGKPLGITLFARLAVRLSDLPQQVGWSHILGAGAWGGIGFTMSLFITGLAFDGGGGGCSQGRDLCGLGGRRGRRLDYTAVGRRVQVGRRKPRSGTMIREVSVLERRARDRNGVLFTEHGRNPCQTS